MGEYHGEPQDVLKSLWLDPHSPVAFTGRHRLLDAARKQGISAKEVDHFLAQQIGYTKHVPRRYKFPKSFYNISKWGHLLEADLAELKNQVAAANKNMRYLLVAIEALSRKLYVIPMRSKSGPDTAAALKKVLKQCPPIDIFRSDHGLEWRAKPVQDLLRSKGIVHKMASHHSKAALAERVILTIQTKIWRYLSHKNSYKFLDILPKLVEGYNETVHSTTGFKPNEVNNSHEYAIWEKVFLKHRTNYQIKPKFKIGDTVRLAVEKEPLGKSYKGNYTDEVFRVRGIRHSNPPTFQLKDLLDEPITSEVYGPELVGFDLQQSPDGVFDIARILEKRKRGGVQQARVTWRNWPAKFSEWIPAANLQDR